MTGNDRLLISFDIDGTMEFGDPSGPISADLVVQLVQRGIVVGCASDKLRSGQAGLWRSYGVQPKFVGGKHHLLDVRERFAADRYIHVGDTEVDEHYALLAGFEFLSVYGEIEMALKSFIEEAPSVARFKDYFPPATHLD